jgi:hydroxyethylthiazole kinase-like uncharacterized protein yjeF
MFTSFDGVASRRIIAAEQPLPLFSVAQTRLIEASAASALLPHALMQRAGEAVARFALALVPNGHRFWIVCGPGNNGGDGLEAARLLKRMGKTPVVTLLPPRIQRPDDASNALKNLTDEGIEFLYEVPATFDACIDALFGIGITGPLKAEALSLIDKMNSATVPVIAIDIPSGLEADTGKSYGGFVAADFTLSLLTLKPGQFTADGRQACGEIWINTLGVAPSPPFCAELNPVASRRFRKHNTHKGTYGDVGIVGGSTGMEGAAMLAAKAALHGGAGRVFIGQFANATFSIDVSQPDLMLRQISEMHWANMTTVAGCGGGIEIALHLNGIMEQARRLVLDADALNAIAFTPELQRILKARSAHSTVLTPHPLEAARLLQIEVEAVQSNRLHTAQSLAEKFCCTVVLKGSGTIIAAPNTVPRINATGNAKLAIAGTGDVLAGLIGARIAAGLDAVAASCEAVYLHGRTADLWNNNSALTANLLAQSIPC